MLRLLSEKGALALGAYNAGARVASDSFTATSTTEINTGIIVICPDYPNAHSIQSEQDTR